jgi:glycosyltransferase involved in cell wall biosynthesis
LVLRLLRGSAALRNLLADKSGLAGFDAEFYYQFYPDLHHLKSSKELARHYLEHGIREGRHKNLETATRSIRERFGDPPEGFDARDYASLNDDLARKFDHDWQYEFHYLEHGRREGRPFRMLAPADLGERITWAHLFRLADFLACAASWLEQPPIDKDAAMRLFVEEGIDRLAPINLDYVFDPIWYRVTRDFDETVADADLYRHWLGTGIVRGWHPNEERALDHLTSDRRYPQAFDWLGYRKSIAKSRWAGAIRLHDRVAVLEDFFQRPFETAPDRFVRGPESGEVYVAIGDYHLVRGHYHIAIDAYDRGIATGRVRIGAIHRRGDAHAALGNISAAHTDFARAAADANAGVWSHVHAARTAATTGSYDKAFEILARARPRWLKNIEYRRARDDLSEMFFRSNSQAAQGLYDVGNRRLGDSLMLDCLEAITRHIVELEGLPPPSPPAADGHIAILACLDLPQCRHYRVEQKLHQLARAGIDAHVHAQHEVDAFVASLVGARAAIFYRVPAFPSVIRAILTARALGIPTYYEIDDLVFDPAAYPDPLVSFEGQISKADYIGLLWGVPLYRYAMSLCDHGISSTATLAREVEKIVRHHDCLVVLNGLDDRNERAIAAGQQPRPQRESVTIFYGSGTKAHNADFNEILGPALLEVMAEDVQVRLVVVGHLHLDPSFELVSDQIQRIPFVADVDAYWSLLAAADINVAVLATTAATDCKSEIKWLEAAILQIPSIVTATAHHREALEDGVDALLVEDRSEAWAAALRALIADAELRRSIGAAARRKALSRNSLDAAADLLRARFGSASDAENRPAFASAAPLLSRDKLKVLVCNVFFAPQSYGGATRVVEDNVDYLIDECPDIEVVVVATDEGVTPPGRLRFDRYRDVLVYRISTPLEVNMDWRPFNPDNVGLFERILDKERPDIVHFHCIQRLTASVVESVRARKTPYFVTLHDGWWISDHQFLVDANDVLRLPSTDVYDAAPPEGISLADSVMRRQRLADLLDDAEQVLAVSESFAEIHRRAGVRKVVAVPNGVPQIRPVEGAPRADGRLVLGHLGGRSLHKGARLVEAVLRTNAFEHLALTMVDNTLEPNARSERIWGNTPVLLRGPCPQSEVASLYASFDVLLAPSIWPESFGLVAREACALGLWVVASDRGAVAEDIEDGRNGFVVDVSDGRGLTKVLGELDRDFRRFKQPAPAATKPMRTAADQGRDIAELYRKTRGARDRREDEGTGIPRIDRSLEIGSLVTKGSPHKK